MLDLENKKLFIMVLFLIMIFGSINTIASTDSSINETIEVKYTEEISNDINIKENIASNTNEQENNVSENVSFSQLIQFNNSETIIGQTLSYTINNDLNLNEGIPEIRTMNAIRDFYGTTYNLLQGEITGAASGDEIRLNNDVTYEGASFSTMTISKNLIINGQGHKIDGRRVARMFIISGNYNVTFINISFVNGTTDPSARTGLGLCGGAIFCYESNNVTVINCTFINNTGRYGGAIFAWTNYLTVTNSEFIDNFAYWNGAGICLEYIDQTATPGSKLGIITVINSSFIRNDANIAKINTPTRFMEPEKQVETTTQ